MNEDSNFQNDNEVRILIAEDSSTQAEQLRYILEQQGYVVTSENNGLKALQTASRDKPSIIISDILMPEMDGYELCRQIKRDENLNSIPVILLTSLYDPKDVIGGLECGADSFIVKPYDRRYLISRIQHILANRQLHRRESVQMGVELYLGGQRYFITADRLQILSLLVSTYEAAVQKNNELIQLQEELRILNDQLEKKVEERTAELISEINERKQAQADLQASLEAQRNLAVIVESTDDAIVRITPEGAIQNWNAGAERMLGYLAGEILGRSLRQLFPPEREREIEEIFRQINHEHPTKPLETVWITRAGAQLQLSLTVSPIRGSAGTIISGAVIARDITDRKTMEFQLRQAQKMEAIGQLAGGVAHDFNNLLQVIIGYASSVMEQCSGNDQLQQDLEQIVNAGDRATELTRQLLAFSRRQVLQPKDIDCNQLVTNVLKMLRRVLGEHLELDFIPGHDLGTVNADPGQLEQILMNLCINARDAMPGGGTLTIETENVTINGAYRQTHGWAREGRYVLLTVSDTGSGMDEETLSRIFEPFFTTKKEGHGTGLGLATVYGIVKQHNGLIHVYSEPDKGTMFKIYLPIVNRQATTVNRTPEGPIMGGSETILIAEDSEAVRKLAVRVLEKAGYEILTAQDGEEALKVFEEQGSTIDLMILDIVMPKLQGRDVYNKIKVVKPNARVLFSSGYSPNTFQTQQPDDLKHPMLQKPYDPKVLLRRVREALDAPQR